MRYRPPRPTAGRQFAVAVAVVAILSACDRAPHTAKSDSGTQMSLPTIKRDAVPEFLQGVWTRDWIARRGVQSNTFDVHYLQTPTVFADMRVPRDRGIGRRVTGWTDLKDEELLKLGKQRGFTGWTSADGAIVRWHHEIDFQPPDTSADIGRVERGDETHMFEHALDSSYVESWRSIGRGEGRYLAVREESAGRLLRTLVVVGDHFLFVRNRARELAPAPSLDSLIATTHARREQIIAYLDCEFSTGRVRGGVAPWTIEQSTLPWREGVRLDFIDEVVVRDGGRAVRPRRESGTKWTTTVNTLSPSALDSLIAGR